mmetsp:Transcript_18418/g.43045  ORF Transcript_18418/g.43045 Transcript_18418/m.43045 type:complete len:309 (-) Transcript_18418:130-1056(-)
MLRRWPILGSLALLRFFVCILCLVVYCASAHCEHVSMISTVTGGTRDEQYTTKVGRYVINFLSVVACNVAMLIVLWRACGSDTRVAHAHHAFLISQCFFDIGQEVWRWNGHAWLAVFAVTFAVLQSGTVLASLWFRGVEGMSGDAHSSRREVASTVAGLQQALASESGSRADCIREELDRGSDIVHRPGLVLAALLNVVVVICGVMMVSYGPGGPPPMPGGKPSRETGRYAMLEYLSLLCYMLSLAVLEQAIPTRLIFATVAEALQTLRDHINRRIETRSERPTLRESGLGTSMVDVPAAVTQSEAIS